MATRKRENIEIAEEIDPNKLISKDGVLGYERGSGFEQVTNFDIKVDGYVGDGEGNVIGYIVRVLMAVIDPLLTRNNTSSKKFFMTNKQMGNHATIINCLTAKFPALWIAQSKDTFLPQFVYNLCKLYMKTPSEEIKRFKPVEIVGKQPDADVWVFNPKIQLDSEGRIIPEEERLYVSMEAGRLPYLHNIKDDLDGGEALRQLLIAEKALFQNNYAQVVLIHAASSMAANYNTIVELFDGCAIPVIRGEPVSGKTTALKSAMSVFGIKHFSSESSSRYIEDKQSKTTIPFGWDDASNIKIVKNVVVNSYNACGSATMKSCLRPQTVPLITTNLETSEEKINSRWLRIAFETIETPLVGKEKSLAEINLRKAMNMAYKSVAVVTVYINNCLRSVTEDESYFAIAHKVEVEAESMAKPVDQRVKRMLGLQLFCTKKILEKIGLDDDYNEVWNKMKSVILPSYFPALDQSVSQTGTSNQRLKTNEDLINDVLYEHFLPAILLEDTKDVLVYFYHDLNPSKCLCGRSIVFHVKSANDCLKKCMDRNVMESVTENSIRNFIKRRCIGCVGVQIRFKGGKQCNTAHIQRSWFKEEDLAALDEKLGKRNNTNQEHTTTTNQQLPDQDGQHDVTSNQPADSVVTNVQLIDQEEGDMNPQLVNQEEGNMNPQLNDQEIPNMNLQPADHEETTIENYLYVYQEETEIINLQADQEETVSTNIQPIDQEELDIFNPQLVDQVETVVTNPQLVEQEEITMIINHQLVELEEAISTLRQSANKESAPGTTITLSTKEEDPLKCVKRNRAVECLFDDLHGGLMDGKRIRKQK